MRYKREEAFRFQFQTPLRATIKIIKVNGKNIEPTVESAEIMDVSPNGLKFKTPLDLSITEQDYLLKITFMIDDKEIYQLGQPIWKKTVGAHFEYGFNGLEDDGTKSEIIQALKAYSRRVYSGQKHK